MRTTVDIRYDHGHYRPTINVKWWPEDIGTLTARWETEGHEASGDADFWSWVKSRGWDDPALRVAEDIARDQGWADAEEAHTEAGLPGKCYSDGRSGGWLIVHSDRIPQDVAEWPVEILSAWYYFADRVADIVADLDYQYIWHLWANVWEPSQYHNVYTSAIATMERTS